MSTYKFSVGGKEYTFTDIHQFAEGIIQFGPQSYIIQLEFDIDNSHFSLVGYGPLVNYIGKSFNDRSIQRILRFPPVIAAYAYETANLDPACPYYLYQVHALKLDNNTVEGLVTFDYSTEYRNKVGKIANYVSQFKFDLDTFDGKAFPMDYLFYRDKLYKMSNNSKPEASKLDYLIGSIDDVIAAAARILVYLDGRMPESGDFGPAVFIGENSSVAVHKYTPLFIRSSDVKNLEFAPT